MYTNIYEVLNPLNANIRVLQQWISEVIEPMNSQQQSSFKTSLLHSTNL